MLIIAFGDIHMRVEAARRIPEIGEADCVVVNGDLTTWGGRTEASTVLSALTALNPRIYAHIGNMDTGEVDLLLTEMGINLNGRGILIGEVGLFGLGGSNPTPFGTPSEFSEVELETKLWKAYSEVKDARFKVLFTHTPPRNTLLDKVRSGEHTGSDSVRRFLEEADCDACVCGHIHEASGTDRLGKATILNPGMLSHGAYVRIDCHDGTFSASLKHC